MNAKKLIKEKEKQEVKTKEEKRAIVSALFNGFQQQLAKEFGLQITAVLKYGIDGIIPAITLMEAEQPTEEKPKVAEEKEDKIKNEK